MNSPRTPKRLIISCDGTWNRPEPQGDELKYKTTNVLKLMRAIRTSDDDGRHQVTYYDTGVGTDRGVYDKYIGGMMGVGLSSHVKKAYRFLANNYEEGDELYFFGFSRGAYTVRVLSGLIGAAGLLRPKDMAYLPEVFSYFRTPPHKRERSRYHHLIKNQLQTRDAVIKFLGVWDTVGALGVPIPLLKWATMWRVGFFNAELGDHIEYAYHALAIDEKRRPFSPNLWTQVDQRDDRPRQTKDVCQVWFPGVHSDVGGGHKDSRLSDEALLWMANRAKDCGLALDFHILPKREDDEHRYAGDLEESFTWVYKPLVLLGMLPYQRPIGRLENPNPIQRIPACSWIWKLLDLVGITRYRAGINEMIHESATKRLDANPVSYSPHNYSPKNLRQAVNRVPVFTEGRYKKRQYGRQRVDWVAELINGEKRGTCKILDFDPAGGVCIKDLANIVQDTSERTLSLTLPPESGGVRQVHAVWKSGQTVGLKFVDISEQSSLSYPRVA